MTVDGVEVGWATINDFLISTYPTSTFDSLKAVGASPFLSRRDRSAA